MRETLLNAGTSAISSPPDIPSVAPWDEHNQKWVSYGHPADWENPTPSGRYNMLVIGAGSAGLVTAIGASGLGDMIAEISLAITNRQRLGNVAKTIHPYPNQAEAVRKVGDLYNRTRLTPFVKRVMNTILAWRR